MGRNLSEANADRCTERSAKKQEHRRRDDKGGSTQELHAVSYVVQSLWVQRHQSIQYR